MSVRNKLLAGLVALLLLSAAGYLTGAHLSGGAWYAFGLPLGGERGELRRTSARFIEDLQFKDFESAAAYHSPERRDAVDVPFLLERMFLIKPELLDITGYEVISAHLDSTGLRARLRMRIKLRDLAREKARTQEIILYYHRESVDSPWYMELESSLRKPKSERGKKTR